MKQKQGKGCVDCRCFRYEAAYYMVHDAVWQEAKGGTNLLCLRCLSQRLGRKLIRADFTDAPCNRPLWSILDCVAAF